MCVCERSWASLLARSDGKREHEAEIQMTEQTFKRETMDGGRESDNEYPQRSSTDTMRELCNPQWVQVYLCIL